MASKILLTGGSGLLGTELQKKLDCYAPTSNIMDITVNPSAPRDTDLIVHCAAYTDVEGAERDKDQCWKVNVDGTYNMASLGIPIIYISTEYVFDGERGNYKEDDQANPVNWYSHTKLAGEGAAREAPESLVIRLVLKEKPWKYSAAFIDQYTSGDYVDVMADLLTMVIAVRNKFKQHDTVHIGTGRKSIYELARQTRNVSPMMRAEVKTPLPYDTSLNTDYWESIWSK